MVAHPWIARHPAQVPVVGASYSFQDSLWALLVDLGLKDMGWHAGRRGGSDACLWRSLVHHCRCREVGQRGRG